MTRATRVSRSCSATPARTRRDADGQRRRCPWACPCPATPSCCSTRAGGCRSPAAGAGASRSRSPTAGSSSPRATTWPPGEVQALHYFARDLVLFRTERRRAHAWSTPTARTSAPTSRSGGKVEGECLRCPFHGWAFDGDGGRASRSPTAAASASRPRPAPASYPTIERNRMIWAWHHAEGEPRSTRCPMVAEIGRPRLDRRSTAASSRSPSPARRWPRTTSTSPTSSTSTAPTPSPRTSSSSRAPTSGRSARTATSCARASASGLGVLRVKGCVTFLSSTTPIDEENVHVRWVFTAPMANGERARASEAADAFCGGVSQDIPIWENKIYRPRPVLTKSETADPRAPPLGPAVLQRLRPRRRSRGHGGLTGAPERCLHTAEATGSSTSEGVRGTGERCGACRSSRTGGARTGVQGKVRRRPLRPLPDRPWCRDAHHCCARRSR